MVASGLVVAVVAVSVVSGKSVLALVACLGVAALVVAPLVGAWNLRNVDARRVLPAEIYAGRPAQGWLVLRNGRRYGPAMAVEVTDEHGAVAEVVRVPPGAEVRRPATWTFRRRGEVTLGRLTVRSVFPFGLSRHVCVVGEPARLTVWAAPASGVVAVAEGALVGTEAARGEGGSGDFEGLRPWRSGDATRRVHWRTTARVGELMVALRGRETGRDREVVVEDCSGVGWERELSRATGAVDRTIRSGRGVRLVLPGDLRTRVPSGVQSGEPGRRTLLDLLATLPQREQSP